MVVYLTASGEPIGTDVAVVKLAEAAATSDNGCVHLSVGIAGTYSMRSYS